jgi:hypothetical protein
VSQQALLTRVLAALEVAAIPSMVTGSLASSLQGEPRATHDIDLVIEIGPGDVDRLVSVLAAPDIYLDERAVREAVRQRTLFNLVHPETGDKVDFWPLTDEPFDRSRFARRWRVDALGTGFDVSSPEDTILMKLRWARQSGGSEKQLTDALRVYELQAARLDHVYMREWAARLEVHDLLDELIGRAEPLGE